MFDVVNGKKCEKEALLDAIKCALKTRGSNKYTMLMLSNSKSTQTKYTVQGMKSC